MVRTYHMEERLWYLAVQDGRLDDKEYDTEQEALTAYNELSEFTKLGVCIMSYVKRYHPADKVGI